jgi:hypothetical protein
MASFDPRGDLEDFEPRLGRRKEAHASRFAHHESRPQIPGVEEPSIAQTPAHARGWPRKTDAIRTRHWVRDQDAGIPPCRSQGDGSAPPTRSHPSRLPATKDRCR